MAESAELETSADNDRSVLQCWHEWEIENGERRIILCVETALELRPGYPGFDSNQLAILMQDQCQSNRCPEKCPRSLDAWTGVAPLSDAGPHPIVSLPVILPLQ